MYTQCCINTGNRRICQYIQQRSGCEVNRHLLNIRASEVMTILRRLHSVSVSYPPDLEQLINAFKLCATVRLFLQVNLAGWLCHGISFFPLNIYRIYDTCQLLIAARPLFHFQSCTSCLLLGSPSGSWCWNFPWHWRHGSSRPCHPLGQVLWNTISCFLMIFYSLIFHRFRLFTPFTALAIAPVEAHYSRELVTIPSSIY